MKIKPSFNIQTDCLKMISKPPKGIPKEAWERFKSENSWNVAKVAIHGKDAYIVMSGAGMEKMTFLLPDFRKHSECEIERVIDESFTDGNTWPLGCNFHDCVCYLRKHGLKGGYVVPITRPME